MRKDFQEFGGQAWKALCERWPTLLSYAGAEDGPRILAGSLEAFTVNNGSTPALTPTVRPNYEDVARYFQIIGFGGDPQDFLDYYTANGWMVGRVKMKDWTAAARLWKRRTRPGGGGFTKRASFA